MVRAAKKSVRQNVLSAAALGVAVLFVFWPAMHVGFLALDDNIQVTANPYLFLGPGLRGIFWALTTFRGDLWGPMSWISYLLDFSIFGLRPAGYHFTNLLLHALNAACLFLALNKMTGRMRESLFAAAWFALHPLRVESVAWITQRKDVLYALFCLLSLNAYIRYVNKSSATRYLGMAALYVLALCSKGLAVTWPLLLLLLDYWPLNRLGRRNFYARIAEKLPLCLFAAIAGALNILAHRFVPAPRIALSIWSRISDAAVFYLEYISKMFWPWDLPLFYPHPGVSLPVLRIIISSSVVAGVSWAAVRFRREYPYLFTGWFWFLISLFPVAGLLQPTRAGMAGRYTYLPQIGIALILAWGGAAAARRFRLSVGPALVLAFAFLTAFSLLVRRELGFWQDQGVLYERTLAAGPDNPVLHNVYGVYLLGQGNQREAEAQFREAVRYDPEFDGAFSNLGLLLIWEGRRAEALTQLRRALEIDPGKSDPHNNLGMLWALEGRKKEAIEEFHRALEIDPNHSAARENLDRLSH